MADEALPAPVQARDAATIMLVRDGAAGGTAALEVCMVRRHLNSDFVGGAYVFPGGKVDEADRSDSLLLLREGRIFRSLMRLRHSWYIGMLLTPGGPTLAWRVVLAGDRWRALLRRDGVPVDASYPSPTVARDGVQGARLYRRNMPRRSLRPRRDAAAHVPVQLIIPTRDRYIPPSYYELAERFAPRGLRRREVEAGHWLPRTDPDRIAEWIGEFVEEVEEGV